MDDNSDGRWREAVTRFGAVVASLRFGQFIVVEYKVTGACDPSPYAQCAPEAGSWYLEVVSQNYLPAGRWPIDELALRRAGWLLPDDETANWWRTAETAEETALLVVSALRCGRMCEDPTALQWRVGTFPPGPDGGLPLPADDAAPLLLAA